jgi:8-oxo-dGTP diphosphatase
MRCCWSNAASRQGLDNGACPGAPRNWATAEACARRELLEETGLEAGPLHLVAHADAIHRDPAGQLQYHYTILDFGAHYIGGEARAGDDVSAFAWVHPDRFDEYDVWPDARRIIALTFSQLLI